MATATLVYYLDHRLTEYDSRRNTILFSVAAVASSYAAVRYRNNVSEERKRKDSYYVTPARSGEFFGSLLAPAQYLRQS